jgi:hypothetical protein
MDIGFSMGRPDQEALLMRRSGAGGLTARRKAFAGQSCRGERFDSLIHSRCSRRPVRPRPPQPHLILYFTLHAKRRTRAIQVQLLCPQGVRRKMGKSKMPRGTAHMTAVRPVARRRRCEAARGFTPDHPCRSACAAVTDIARLPKSKWESYPPPLRRIQLPLGLGA